MTVSIVQDLQSGTVSGTPVPWESGKSAVKIQTVMSDDTARDPQNNFLLRVMASYDGGKSYIEEGRGPWTGNPANDPFNPGHPIYPARGVTFAVNMPTHIMPVYEVGAGLAISFGANVVFS